MSLVMEARAVTKVYFAGTPDEMRALDAVSASFEAGGLHLIWGPSGSGKTTLLALLGALDDPSDGEIWLEGESLTARSEPALALFRRRRLGVLLQGVALLPGVPAWANATLSMIPDGWNDAERRAAGAEALARLGLSAKVDRTPEQLSGGEAQRVGLARALVRDPDVLLADEPTSQLDAASAQLVIGMMTERARAGKLVIVTSHDPAVRAAARWVTELAAGKLTGTTTTTTPRGPME